MNRALLFILLALSTVLITVSVCSPEIFVDNDFLKNFIETQFIQVVTVLVTVSLVNAQQLHFEYTRLERRLGKKIFQHCRLLVHRAVIILVAFIPLALLVAITYPSFIDDRLKALSQTISLLIVIECVFAMFDLVYAASTLAENTPVDECEDESR